MAAHTAEVLEQSDASVVLVPLNSSHSVPLKKPEWTILPRDGSLTDNPSLIVLQG